MVKVMCSMSRKSKPKHKLSCKTTWRRMQGSPVIANNQRKNLTYPFDVSYDLLDEGEGFEQNLHHTKPGIISIAESN